MRVTDYWREPFARSECRRGLSDFKRPDDEELTEKDREAVRDALVEPGIPWSEVEADLRSD